MYKLSSYSTIKIARFIVLEQLNEIKKVKLSRILCDNSDNIITIQPNALEQPSQYKYAKYFQKISFSFKRARNSYLLVFVLETTECLVKGICCRKWIYGLGRNTQDVVQKRK